MKIKSISRTMSFGNYENISMCAEVEESEIVSEVVAKIENSLQEEIYKKTGTRRLSSEVSSLRYEKERLSEDVEQLKNKIGRLTKFLADHGVTVTYNSELPF